MFGAGVSWGLYFFLLVCPLTISGIIFLFCYVWYRYNTFKFHLQEGMTSKSLHPISHLACASVSGWL